MTAIIHCVETRGAHSFRPRVRQGLTPPVGTSTLGPSSAVTGPSATTDPSAAAAGASPSVLVVRPSVAAALAAPTVVQSPAVADAEGSSSVAPAHKRYHTRVGPTPPAPSHPRPARMAVPANRTRTSGPTESSPSRPRAPPSPPYQGITGALDLSQASIIRRPYFPYDPIPGNVDCRGRDFHGEVYYDLPTFAEDPGLQDSMLLMQRYLLESFMVSRRFYYPQVVIEFFHTMTSRYEANPTTLHFSIDGRRRILRASDITAALHLPVVLANTPGYRQWPHPSTREMVRLLSIDATGGSILFRRHLPQRMLLIYHILRSNVSTSAYCSEEMSYLGGAISHFRGLVVQPGRADYDIFISFRGQGPPLESTPHLVHASFISSTIISYSRAHRVSDRASIGASSRL